ncbi:MAG: hypothetical protein CMI30_10750 [Opitutae bacterium]|nr:hypothetical protein [Opitutae bacterium]
MDGLALKGTNFLLSLLHLSITCMKLTLGPRLPRFGRFVELAYLLQKKRRETRRFSKVKGSD